MHPSEAFGDQNLHIPADELRARVPEELLGLNVDQVDPSAGPDHDHRVRGGIQQLAVKLFGVDGQLADDPVLFTALPLQANHVGHVLDVMDDVNDAALRIENRTVDRAPVPLFEATALGFRTPNIVLLDGHRIRSHQREHARERGPQIRDPGCGRVVGVVGEDLEQRSTDDRLPARHRRLEVRIAYRHDRQVRAEHQVTAR